MDDLIHRKTYTEIDAINYKKAIIPYMWDYRDGRIFNCSFEDPLGKLLLKKYTKGVVSDRDFKDPAIFIAKDGTIQKVQMTKKGVNPISK